MTRTWQGGAGRTRKVAMIDDDTDKGYAQTGVIYIQVGASSWSQRAGLTERVEHKPDRQTACLERLRQV